MEPGTRLQRHENAGIAHRGFDRRRNPEEPPVNRKHFVASAASLVALGVAGRDGSEVAASGNYTAAPVAYPGEARIAALELAVSDLIHAVNKLSDHILAYAPVVNTVYEDNDDVSQTQVATNRQQIVAAGSRVIADGQIIDQSQCQDVG